MSPCDRSTSSGRCSTPLRGRIRTREERVDASLYFELKTFLHGLLVVEDKFSMAHSLETRLPFLDNDLVDFALRLPAADEAASDSNRDVLPMDENLPASRCCTSASAADGKVVLRKAMARVIPEDVTARAKQGFSAPDASWFRGESVDYVTGLLDGSATRA